MHDPLGMRFRQTLARLQHQLDRIDGSQRTAGAHECAQIMALEELHHDEGSPVLEEADVLDLHDVLPTQSPGDSRLAQKPLGRLPDLETPGQHDLDRDQLTEPQVRGSDDGAHAADTQCTLDPESPGEHLPWREVYRSRHPSPL